MNPSVCVLSTAISVFAFTLVRTTTTSGATADEPALRPPAVPLVTSNPYFSVWSMADRLTDDETRHWTRREHPLSSLIRINGKTYRLMGKTPENIPPLPQVGLRVLPTRTIYDFEGDHVRLTLTFMTPALPDDLPVLARPLTYLTWEVRSTDREERSISILATASAAWPPILRVRHLSGRVRWQRPSRSFGSGRQANESSSAAGDSTSIDWGYLYLGAPGERSSCAVGAGAAIAERFATGGTIDSDAPHKNRDSGTGSGPDFVLAVKFDEFKAAAVPSSRHLMIAYDELYAIKFLGRKLQPYWRRDGAGAVDLLRDGERDYDRLVERCANFDTELMADLSHCGGQKYAQMAALAFRQTLAGCGLAADSNQQPLFFAKENSSNGCVATVDVIYPAAPQFLLMGPAYARGARGTGLDLQHFSTMEVSVRAS